VYAGEKKLAPKEKKPKKCVEVARGMHGTAIQFCLMRKNKKILNGDSFQSLWPCPRVLCSLCMRGGDFSSKRTKPKKKKAIAGMV
jgi:hypothetical protein